MKKMKFIDLGLPSGTLWANCNVGADSSSELGDLLDYGQIPENGVPTQSQWQELIDNCDSHFVNNYEGSGADGVIFVSKANGKIIFLPAAGYHNGTSVNCVGANGYYWSSTYDVARYTCTICLDPDNVCDIHYFKQNYGHSVRLVRDRRISVGSKVYVLVYGESSDENDFYHGPTRMLKGTVTEVENEEEPYISYIVDCGDRKIKSYAHTIYNRSYDDDMKQLRNYLEAMKTNMVETICKLEQARKEVEDDCAD